MSEQYDVIVVGAGMVGMAAALGLAQKGLRVALMESQPQKNAGFPVTEEPYDHRVVAIVRASERLFEQLGVWQAMQNARVSPYEEMIVWDNEGDGQIQFSSSMLFESNLGHIVEQRVIIAALWEKVKTHTEITCFFEAMIVAIRHDKLSCEITLKNQKILSTSLLIGADGAKSMVRQALSIETEKRLKALGIPVISINEGPIELYFDGADECNEHAQLIKGGGAALTGEKIIAAASKKFICMIDSSKFVKKLGTFPLPIEVIPMARSYVARELVKMGGDPVLRDGVITDYGNQILDVYHLNIMTPIALEEAINNITGVVTNGLFAKRGADKILIGTQDGIKVHFPV